MSFRPSSPVLRALSLCCLNSYFKFCCLIFTFGKVRSFSSQLSLNSSKISFQIAVRTLLEAPFSLSKREAQAQSSFVSSTDQSAALVSVSVSVHLSIRKRVKKKSASTLLKKTREPVWQGLSRQYFLQKQSII